MVSIIVQWGVYSYKIITNFLVSLLKGLVFENRCNPCIAVAIRERVNNVGDKLGSLSFAEMIDNLIYVKGFVI